MRVLHVIPSISPRRGGPSAVIFPMVAALRARGMEAEIATSDEDATSSHASCGDAVQHHEVPVWYFPRWSTFLRPVRELHLFATVHRVAQAQHPQLRPDPRPCAFLAHPHHGHARGADERRSLHQPSARPAGALAAAPERAAQKLYLQMVEHRNLRGAGALHFTSESERAEAAAVVPVDRSAVIPHGIESARIRSRSADQTSCGTRSGSCGKRSRCSWDGFTPRRESICSCARSPKCPDHAQSC